MRCEAFVAHLHAGELIDLLPIGAGIENTNYFVTTSAGPWVLTVFERLTREQLPFYLRLMQHLARRALPVPEPRADAGRRAGAHACAASRRRCARGCRGSTSTRRPRCTTRELGRVLAGLHAAAADFSPAQPNLRGLAWWQATAPRVRPFLDDDAAQLLDEEMAFQQQLAASAAYAGLPRAAVHADLFRDNVLFDGDHHEHLSGCVDFYFAGVDTLLFDLAVCVNDWCLADDSGRIDEARAAALLGAYGERRALSAAEHRLFPALLRAAALRFWLSRLADRHLPREAALLQPKDPRHFERLLRERVAQPWHPPR